MPASAPLQLSSQLHPIHGGPLILPRPPPFLPNLPRPRAQWEVIVKVGSANNFANIPLQSMGGDRPLSGSELSDVGSDVEGMPLRGDD